MKIAPKIIVALVVVAASGPASAGDTAGGIASESRDASAAFVATQSFIVGRIGRDCLGELGRTETPAEYQKQWQRENAKYYDASIKYMEARLEEIEDHAEKDGVENAYYSSVNERGEAAAAQLMGKGSKDEVCTYWVALIDAGKMNIEAFVKASKQPLMESLTERVEWARAN